MSTSTFTLDEFQTAACCVEQIRSAGDNQRESKYSVKERQSLAFRYPQLLSADKRLLAELPIGVAPEAYKQRLRWYESNWDRWAQFTSPAETHAVVVGDFLQDVISKRFESPLSCSLIASGAPPESGVWNTHAVMAVATMDALSEQYNKSVNAAYIEYPAYGVIRPVHRTKANETSYLRTRDALIKSDSKRSMLQKTPGCEECSQSCHEYTSRTKITAVGD